MRTRHDKMYCICAYSDVSHDCNNSVREGTVLKRLSIVYNFSKKKKFFCLIANFYKNRII